MDKPKYLFIKLWSKTGKELRELLPIETKNKIPKFKDKKF